MNKQVAEQTIYFPLFAEQSFFTRKVPQGSYGSLLRQNSTSAQIFLLKY